MIVWKKRESKIWLSTLHCYSFNHEKLDVLKALESTSNFNEETSDYGHGDYVDLSLKCFVCPFQRETLLFSPFVKVLRENDLIILKECVANLHMFSFCLSTRAREAIYVLSTCTCLLVNSSKGCICFSLCLHQKDVIACRRKWCFSASEVQLWDSLIKKSCTSRMLCTNA